MPRAPKICGTAGCTTLTTSSNCPEHTTSRWNNTTRRASKASNAAHKRWRTTVLTRDNWQCQLQYPGICTGSATTADHKHAIKLGGNEYDPNNGQAACWSCHNRKSSAEGHQAQGHRTRNYRDGGLHPPPPGQPV